MHLGHREVEHVGDDGDVAPLDVAELVVDGVQHGEQRSPEVQVGLGDLAHPGRAGVDHVPRRHGRRVHPRHRCRQSAHRQSGVCCGPGADGSGPTASRVDVEGVAPHEPGEGEPGRGGGLDRQGRRRRHGDHRLEPGGPRLLHHLERGPTADEQAQAGGRQAVVEQQPTDHLVDGVVAADVLADDAEGAGAVERGGGVGGTGAAEEVLLGAGSSR